MKDLGYPELPQRRVGPGMNVTDPEVREDEWGRWSVRCKVDGEIRYVVSNFDATSGKKPLIWLAEPPLQPAIFDSRADALEGLDKAVDYSRRATIDRAKREARAARLASHPNGGWDPA